MERIAAQNNIERDEYSLTSLRSRVCSSPLAAAFAHRGKETQTSHVQLAHTTHRQIRRDDGTIDSAMRCRIARRCARRRLHPDDREASALAAFPLFSKDSRSPGASLRGCCFSAFSDHLSAVSTRHSSFVIRHSSFALVQGGPTSETHFNTSPPAGIGCRRARRSSTNPPARVPRQHRNVSADARVASVAQYG